MRVIKYNMEYMWTDKYVREMTEMMVNEKFNDDTIYNLCMSESDQNKDGAIQLYNLVKELIRTKYRG